jgi:hypothetical protein
VAKSTVLGPVTLTADWVDGRVVETAIVRC